MARRAEVLKFQAGSSWGAGFAIAPNRALTSLRAVGAVVDGALALHAAEVQITAELTDSDGENDVTVYPSCTCTVDDVVDFDGELGWIVFDVDSSTFVGMALPVLGAVIASDAEGSCTSYGFPEPAADLGAQAEGVVLAIDAPIQRGASAVASLQVKSRSAASPDGGPATGFLGAPVMVGRHIVGLVCDAAASAGGAATAAVLHAIPMTALAQRLKLALDPRGERSEPPPEAVAPEPARVTGKSRGPKIAGPLARLRTRFRGARMQIEEFAQYTELHQVLQQLELPFHALARDRRRLAAGPGVWNELREPLDGLRRLLVQALALLEARPLPDLTAAKQRITDADALLAIALEGEATALDAALLQVRRVLDLDLSSASRRMRGALHELGLGDVVSPLRAALNALPRDDTSDPHLDELPPLVTSVEALHGRLETLVRDHAAWQGIDSELAFFADAGRAVLDDAARAWPALRRRLDAELPRAHDARWTPAITAARARVDRALAGNARPSARLTDLRALWRACHLHFIEIHDQVVATCAELARVSATLGGLLDGMKQIDG